MVENIECLQVSGGEVRHEPEAIHIEGESFHGGTKGFC